MRNQESDQIFIKLSFGHYMLSLKSDYNNLIWSYVASAAKDVAIITMIHLCCCVK